MGALHSPIKPALSWLDQSGPARPMKNKGSTAPIAVLNLSPMMASPSRDSASLITVATQVFSTVACFLLQRLQHFVEHHGGFRPGGIIPRRKPAAVAPRHQFGLHHGRYRHPGP